MDTLAHAVIGGLFFSRSGVRAVKHPTGKPFWRDWTFWAAAGFGSMPDLASFGAHFCGMLFSGELREMLRRFLAGDVMAAAPPVETLPHYVILNYQLTHSLVIALAAGVLCVILTMMLLWSSRELRARQQVLAGQALELSGMLILAMPGIVLATGFFLLLNNSVGLPESADGIVIFTNALMAIPYALKVLENPMRDVTARYSMLCQSLGIEGWSRLKVVELRALKRPLAQALAFACVLSIGDFGVVALFGNDDFRTLPFYLYQQIGSYRSQDGAVTALLLLMLCFMLFTVIEKLPGRNVKTD